MIWIIAAVILEVTACAAAVIFIYGATRKHWPYRPILAPEHRCTFSHKEWLDRDHL